MKGTGDAQALQERAAILEAALSQVLDGKAENDAFKAESEAARAEIEASAEDEIKERKAENVAVVVGGIIPPKDYEFLRGNGVGAVFGPGTTIPKAVSEVLEVLREHRE